MTDIEKQILENQIAIMRGLNVIYGSSNEYDIYSLRNSLEKTQELLNPVDVSCINCKFKDTKSDSYPCCTCIGCNKWIKGEENND